MNYPRCCGTLFQLERHWEWFVNGLREESRIFSKTDNRAEAITFLAMRRTLLANNLGSSATGVRDTLFNIKNSQHATGDKSQ